MRAIGRALDELMAQADQIRPPRATCKPTLKARELPGWTLRVLVGIRSERCAEILRLRPLPHVWETPLGEAAMTIIAGLAVHLVLPMWRTRACPAPRQQRTAAS